MRNNNGERLDWARKKMVETQFIPRGLKDEKVLETMRKVPRHLFVQEAHRTRAYEDYPLPIVDHGWARERVLAAYAQARLEP